VPIRNSEGLPTMAPAALRSLARHFEIGSHTADHCYLRKLDAASAMQQITDGKTRLEDLLGQDVAGFCYPGGSYRRATRTQVQDAGFVYARTTTNLCFDTGNCRFELPTTLQFYPHGQGVYWRNFARAGRWHARLPGLRLALAHPHWIARLYALFDHACQHETCFHLWTHAYEVEQLRAWGELDSFFAYVGRRIAVPNRLTNHQLAARCFTS
jgi:peptidoglycan/xylan/chitin deacetylase (PgdA/CDA1 family)